MVARKFTIWQCRDFCCASRAHDRRWWNVGIAPGNYHTVDSWRAALAMAASGRLPWS